MESNTLHGWKVLRCSIKNVNFITSGSPIPPWGGGKVYHSLYREITLLSVYSLFFVGNHSNLGEINIMGWKLNAMKIGTLTPRELKGGA